MLKKLPVESQLIFEPVPNGIISSSVSASLTHRTPISLGKYFTSNSAGVVKAVVVGYNSLPTILNLTFVFSLYSGLMFLKYTFNLSKSVELNGDKLPVDQNYRPTPLLI